MNLPTNKREAIERAFRLVGYAYNPTANTTNRATATNAAEARAGGPIPIATIPIGANCVFHLVLADSDQCPGGGFLIGYFSCDIGGEQVYQEAICIPEHVADQQQ